MKRLTVLLPLALALSACQLASLVRSPDQLEQAQCIGYGYYPGTAAFSACRMQLQQQRQIQGGAMLGLGAAILQSNQPRPLYAPGQSPFTQYVIGNRVVNCQTLGNQTICR